MGNTDPNNTKAGKQIRGQASPSSRWKSSVRDILARQPSQLDGSDTTTPLITTPMIALDHSSTTTQSAGHNVAFNQVINRSNGSICINYKNRAQNQEETLTKSSRKLKSCRVSLLRKGSSSTVETLFSTPTNPTSSWYQSREFLQENPAPPISLKKEA
ncbi:oxysterol-binding protein-related protein 3C-like [Dorcoceras hygrometricum]|uniref:Oxysterol-binding protein-related protein 3C-like n=1 Tax=Dorcoceras hygrometricum TaxID=472368 RepID=A0A2Z7CSK9_9LAMI|nr:oxysterol-binding protein-related protein 3C-like [Dorcoceras hygrometricum]